MTDLTLHELIPVIQTAIGPVILISGVGLLLLSLTNRYGRINDRARSLIRELREAVTAQRAPLRLQLELIERRARLIRMAIILATTSVLLAGLLIIALFSSALLRLEAGVLIVVIFILCIASLVASLVVFLAELQTSLNALEVELKEADRS